MLDKNSQVLAVNAAGTALAFGSVPVSGGGTGQSNLIAHTVIVGNGVSSVSEVGPGAVGTVFIGQGASLDPAFTATPTLGVNGSVSGSLSIARMCFSSTMNSWKEMPVRAM